MSKTILLFSTNAKLAYEISLRYYNDIHYVWCATFFNNNLLSPLEIKNPSSSIPYIRYKNLYNESTGSATDKHGPYILATKAGIRVGAEKKLQEKIINEHQRDEILKIVNDSECSDYRPLLYIMPYDSIERLITYPGTADLANSFSTEIIIEKLPRDKFIIEILEEKL
jgi:hypothetical protein